MIVSGTADTVVLNTRASLNTEAYLGQSLFLRSGLGEDQVRHVKAYDGPTRTVTVCRPWDVIPDNTSAYVMLPTGYLEGEQLAQTVTNAVWGTDDAKKLLEEILGHAERSVDDLHVTIRNRSDNSISHEFAISSDGKVRTAL